VGSKITAIKNLVRPEEGIWTPCDLGDEPAALLKPPDCSIFL